MNSGLKVRELPLFLTSKVIFFPISRFRFLSTLACRTMSSDTLICTSLPFLPTISPWIVCPGTMERIWRFTAAAFWDGTPLADWLHPVSSVWI